MVFSRARRLHAFLRGVHASGPAIPKALLQRGDAKNAEIRGENQAKTLRASAFSALFALRSSVQIHEIRIESRNREAVGGDAGLLERLTQPVRGQLLNAAVSEADFF